MAVKTKGWARHFQANTIKHRAVLSVFFLGCVFRPKLDTDSGASRSLIPVQADHLFRSNPITDSAAKPITFVGASGIGRAGRAEGASGAG
jgi:hypothetical protein